MAETRPWAPPRLWEGQTAYILGGGPSLAGMDLSPIHGRRVLGVNQAYTLGPWVEVTWFGDHRWFEWNVSRLRSYPGLVVTCAREFIDKKSNPAWVKLLRRGEQYHGIETRPGYVAWNGNSGASAVNLAWHLGCARVVLLGFDMRRTPGAPNEGHNWHADHAGHHTPPADIYERRFLRCWPYIARDAERLGLEILNATPGSAIEEFRRVTLEDAVACNPNPRPAESAGSALSEATS